MLSQCYFYFLLDPKIEIVAPSEVAKDFPIQTMDERFSYTLSDVHQEGLKKSGDYEAMGESL